MNEIKITLSIPGLPEAINNLAEALRGNNVSVPMGSEAKATQPETTDAPQTPVNPTQTVPQNTPAVTPTAAASTAPVATAPTVNAPADAVVNYTIDQLSVAGAALCEQGKMAQLIALLGKYGVQAVTQLKPTPDVLNPFAAEMKALGANL